MEFWEKKKYRKPELSRWVHCLITRPHLHRIYIYIIMYRIGRISRKLIKIRWPHFMYIILHYYAYIAASAAVFTRRVYNNKSVAVPYNTFDLIKCWTSRNKSKTDFYRIRLYEYPPIRLYICSTYNVQGGFLRFTARSTFVLYHIVTNYLHWQYL